MIRDRDTGLTHERLKEVLDYDPETGLMRWKTRLSGCIKVGAVAGCHPKNDKNDYVLIRIDGHLYWGHRIIWFWMKSEWPDDQIDHEDRVKHNNKWDNLRPASNVKNSFNKVAHRDSTTKYKGVTKNGTGFKAFISIKGIGYNLGTYETLAEAAAAYEAGARILHADFYRTK